MAAPATATTATAATKHRIASFLPAATEMLYSLGLGDQVVGVTHECDYPKECKQKPVLVECVLNLEGLTMKEIDDAVSTRLKEGKSLYNVNEEKLRAAKVSLLAPGPQHTTTHQLKPPHPPPPTHPQQLTTSFPADPARHPEPVPSLRAERERSDPGAQDPETRPDHCLADPQDL